jgi:hypothetical protein
VQVDGGIHSYGNHGPQCDASSPCLNVPQHYLDIVGGSNSVSQQFTTRCEGRIELGGWFSTRADQAAAGKVQLLDGSTVVATLSASLPAGKSQTDPWTPVSGTATVVANHTYTFVATLDDNANFDNAYVHYLTACDDSRCSNVDIGQIKCNPSTGGFTVTAVVPNNTGAPVQYVTVTPPPGAAYSVSPNVVAQTINTGGSAAVTVTVSGATAGQPVCLEYSLQDAAGHACCVVRRCITPPDCACMKIVQTQLGCDPGPDEYLYSFNLTNASGATIQQLIAIPSVGSVTPQLVATNIPPGATVPITLHLDGLTAGQQVCIVLQSLRDDATVAGQCCTVRVCFTPPHITTPCD